MSDREYCKNCAHFTESSTCDFPTPAWVDSPPIILDPMVARTCNTFSQKMEVQELTSEELREKYQGSFAFKLSEIMK